MEALLTDAPQVSAYEMTLARDMADTLFRHYPGEPTRPHLWAVSVNAEQGIAEVRNLGLSGQWGFQLNLPHNYSASDFAKRVMRAGGELLERFRVSRGRAGISHIDALPTNHAGLHTPDAD